MFCPLCDFKKNFAVVWENQKVCLAFDNYGLHYGHLLLIPKKHVLNMSLVYSNIKGLVYEIIMNMEKFFQTEIVVYEHGNVVENQTTNYSIDHAHIHFLPVFQSTENIIDILSKNIIFEKTNFSGFYEQEQKHSYHLLSVNSVETIYTVCKLESEAFRKAYAECEGVQFWDWKIYGEAIQQYNKIHYSDKMLLKYYMIKEMKHD